MTAAVPDLDADLAELVSAEDFLDYFGIAFEPTVVQISRLHILQRFHDYLAARDEPGGDRFAAYRDCLARAYRDFVDSDVLTERVFGVLKRAAGIATVPLAAVGRART